MLAKLSPAEKRRKKSTDTRLNINVRIFHCAACKLITQLKRWSMWRSAFNMYSFIVFRIGRSHWSSGFRFLPDHYPHNIKWYVFNSLEHRILRPTVHIIIDCGQHIYVFDIKLNCLPMCYVYLVNTECCRWPK